MEVNQKLSLADQAYQRIRHEILVGTLAPGDVVSERELAGNYEMSKTPIREAVTQICREGLMQRLPGRGYMVSPITIKEIRDLFDMRLILELAAVEYVVKNPAPDHCDKLKEMAQIKYVLDDPESYIIFLEANREFHLTLAEATGNQRLYSILEKILIEMERLFHLGLRVRDSSEEMAKEHQDLCKSIEDGDLEAAKELMTDQILTSRQRILEAIMRGDLKPIQAI